MNFKTGFIIGNGESRKGLDLNLLKEYGPVFGCNALYRDFQPDILVCHDPDIQKEVLENYPGHVVYRKGKHLVSNHCPEYQFRDPGWSCGSAATLLMLDICPDIKEIYLVGFDLFSKTGKHNNMYKGTDCYRGADEEPTYPGNFIGQFRKIFEGHDHVHFYRVTDPELPNPFEWSFMENIENIDYPTMMRDINQKRYYCECGRRLKIISIEDDIIIIKPCGSCLEEQYSEGSGDAIEDFLKNS